MATFFPRLDGLRAFAVVAVMVYHWHHPTLFGRELPLGFVGVQLFFVLSGFLIGGILIRAQERNESEGTSQAFTLRQFVIRRAIRIFPAYFAFLLLTALVLGAPDDQWWWYPLYLNNFRMATTVEWPLYWSHTWTLAVEEQFYVVAPLLVLFLQRKTFAFVLPAFIAASGAFILATPASSGMNLVMPKAFYGLLLGIGLALLTERRLVSKRTVHLWGAASMVLSVVAFVFEIHDGRLMVVTAPLAFGALVLWATGTSPLGRFLEWKPLMHLGGLAYGLYLWHMPVPDLREWLQLPSMSSWWGAFALHSLLTYLLAWLSWTLLEQPLNRYKRCFAYHRSHAEAERSVDAQPAVR